MKRHKAVSKRIFILVFLLLFLCGCMPLKAYWPDDSLGWPQTGPEKAPCTPLVAYVPLDNRSVNVQRVTYLAESCGYCLALPDGAAYTTLLDGQPLELGSSGAKQGDRAAILAWLEDMETQGCDNYILSLDQLMSGGLAPSRYLNMEEDEAFGLSQAAAAGLYAQILDFLTALAQDGENRIYILDTVMRLCFTDSYGGCDLALYNALRAYSQLERPELETVEDPTQLLSLYPMTPDGPALDQLPVETAKLLQEAELEGLPALERFHNARLRKLYILRDLTAALGAFENVSYFVGLDDSGTEKNIQTGDIHYVEARLSACAGESFLYDGADELGMCALARLYGEESGTLGVGSLSVRYFGGGEDQILSNYDSRPLAENIAAHAASLGLKLDTAGEISLLVLTGAGGDIEADCAALGDQLAENLAACTPTIVLDASCGRGGAQLAELLIESGNMGLLFGFSSYNTLGNSIGIALSMGACRYRYLASSTAPEPACARGHLRSLAVAYLKEFVYKDVVQAQMSAAVTEQGLYSENFYARGQHPDIPALEAQLQAAMEKESQALLAALGQGRVVSSLKPYGEEDLGQVSFRDCHFPWYRVFEIDFTVEIQENTENKEPPMLQHGRSFLAGVVQTLHETVQGKGLHVPADHF